MALLPSLPDEILLEILGSLYLLDDFTQYGDKSDVFSACLVCRRLAAIGQDVIFEHIKFLVDDVGFARLLELSRSPLRMRVRKLSCYFQIDRTEDSLINSRFQSLLGLAENGTTSLAEALRQFQNLRAIKIWQNWRSSWFWGLNNKESQYLTAYPIGYRLFQNIIHGLATSQNSIEGLTLGSDRPFCPEWNLVGFNLFPWVFAKMERLKVVLPKLAGNTGFGEYGLNSRGLKTLIELSPYLKELHLSIDMSLTDEPFVPDLDIPKLQHLVFNGLLFPDISVLVSFLGRHIATLKTVELDHITLLNSSRTLRRKLFRDGLGNITAIMKKICN